MLLLFGIGGAIAAVPTFLTLERVTSPVVATLVILLPITLQSGSTANNALVKAGLFPAHIRGLGVALPYAIGNAICGGTGESVGLWRQGPGVAPHFTVNASMVIRLAGVRTQL